MDDLLNDAPWLECVAEGGAASPLLGTLGMHGVDTGGVLTTTLPDLSVYRLATGSYVIPVVSL